MRRLANEAAFTLCATAKQLYGGTALVAMWPIRLDRNHFYMTNSYLELRACSLIELLFALVSSAGPNLALQ